MMEMKALQEKKARLEEQHLPADGREEVVSLQERRLQEEETLLGRRYREEKERDRQFEALEYGGQGGSWVNEQNNEKHDWRAEKKLRLEEARELDRMWDMVKRKGKYERSAPERLKRNLTEESVTESDLTGAGVGEYGGRRTLDLSSEIAERERELRRREEKLRQEERKLDEISRAEKERDLREREERLRRKERELEEIARRSRREEVLDFDQGRRERSRSSGRSSSSRYDRERSSRGTDGLLLGYYRKERQRNLKEEVTLEISIPNQPEDDFRRQDYRELSSFSDRSFSLSSEHAGINGKVGHDYNEVQERKLFGKTGARKLKRRRSRNRRLPWGVYGMTKSSHNGNSPSESSSQGFIDESDAMPRAPVKSRLGVKRDVKERLGRRSKLTKQEMERDLSMAQLDRRQEEMEVQYEGRAIAELQVSLSMTMYHVYFLSCFIILQILNFLLPSAIF